MLFTYMLRRQRTILRLLRAADTKVAATQLQKYAFLLREETFIGRDATFYEFVPYRFGAYSFAAQREIEALSAYGYIEPAGTSLAITAAGNEEARHVDADTARAAAVIISKYGKMPLQTLLKDVYTRYPWYASRSELKELVPPNIPRPKPAPIAVYTAGYECRSVDGFLNMLLKSGMQRILDIRANPVSRKYGFARRSLASLAAKVGLGYSHCPSLGISSERRRTVQSQSDFQELFGYYERQTLPANADAVAKAVELMQTMPSVLVCMEKEAADCHRSRLATLIANLTRLSIVHL